MHTIVTAAALCAGLMLAAPGVARAQLHYVTSIVPDAAAAALDLAGLESDKDL